MNYKIAPSILSADFSQLSVDVDQVEASTATMLHIDVMDGHFVPNLTIGPVVVKGLRPKTKLEFDVHLMLEHPQKYIEAFVKAGADIITVHVESNHNVLETIKLIKSFGVKAGVSLNPDTPAIEIKGLLDEVDLVLLMTVHPGFGGQSFIEEVVPKIKQVREWINLNDNKSIDLEVDGGINKETLEICKEAGANVFVAGNYVFGKGNIKGSIATLQDVLDGE